MSLSVGFDGAERVDVQDRSARVHAVLVGSITSLHDSVSGTVVEWTGDDLQVWAERPWSNDGAQLPLVHHSRAALTATFTDFVQLSLWLDDTAGHDGVTVGGISWTVTDLTRRELEARAQRDAVALASDKAAVYAASLGLGAVTPLELTEPSIFAQPFPGAESRMFAMSAAAGSPIDFTPAPVRVAVGIHARFEARPTTVN